MKKTSVFFIVAFSFLAARADLYWSNSQAILDSNGDPVPASDSDFTIGYFAQLIFAGANNTADAFAPSANGVTGDDVVAATKYAGQGYFLFEDGFFPLELTPSIIGSAGNGFYFVRVFDAPNPDFELGVSAPIVGNFYWQSEIHEYTHSPTTPDQWDFAPSGGQTTLAIVPEPGVLAMMGLGLFGLAAARRRLQA